MAHHERSIRERVITVAEKGGLSASTAGEQYGIPMSTAREWLRKYWRDGQVGRRRELGCGAFPAQDAALVAEAERNPSSVQGNLKLLLAFQGKKKTIMSRLKAAGFRARHAALKEFLTDEHQLYHFAFPESNVERKWDRVIFTDESTFSSAIDGPVLVYRPK